MTDREASTDQIWAYLLWAVAIIVLVAGWIEVLLTPYWKLGAMLTATAIMISAAAAVRHVRWYSIRVCEVVRRNGAHGHRGGPMMAPSVHSID